jgi:uncharacterized protein YjbJ (UPF0337 family)
MNWQQIEGQWDTFKAKVRQKWSKLTDDDLNQIGGRKDELIARLKTRYGNMKDSAEKEVDEWMKNVDRQGQQPQPPRH